MLPKLGPGRNSSERRESTRSLGKALAHSMVKMKHSGWGAEKDNPSKSTCRGRWGCFSWGRTVTGGRSGCCFRWAPVSKLDQNQDPVQSCQHRTGALPAGKRRRAARAKQTRTVVIVLMKGGFWSQILAWLNGRGFARLRRPGQQCPDTEIVGSLVHLVWFRRNSLFALASYHLHVQLQGSRNGISAPLSPTERALPTDSAGVRVDSRVLCGR